MKLHLFNLVLCLLSTGLARSHLRQDLKHHSCSVQGDTSSNKLKLSSLKNWKISLIKPFIVKCVYIFMRHPACIRTYHAYRKGIFLNNLRSTLLIHLYSTWKQGPKFYQNLLMRPYYHFQTLSSSIFICKYCIFQQIMITRAVIACNLL